jgi:predicted  nucleic acid-binding Zn-ribbon protein
MSMVAKILIVLNLILAVMVMGAAGAYLQSAEDWRGRYTAKTGELEGEITELTDRVGKTQASLDEANRKAAAAATAQSAAEGVNRTLSENNALLEKKLDDYNANLQGLNERVKDLTQNLSSAQDRIATLEGEKKTAEDEKRSALSAKSAAETEQKRLENEVANLTGMLEGQQKNNVELAEMLEAANTTITIYKEQYGAPGTVAAPVKGMVLAADSKMDIYLISIGSKDGVKTADELTVYRNDQFVAEVVVDTVFEDKASVIVKRIDGKPFKKMDIQQGDKVATVY